MTGKKWFYWLGKLHGSNGIKRSRKTWPEWAQKSYKSGWYEGFYGMNYLLQSDF